jgi:uncharacterized repeat protein (TIGR03803 family)
MRFAAKATQTSGWFSIGAAQRAGFLAVCGLTTLDTIPAQVSEIVVHDFVRPSGSITYAGVILSPGAIYGTTQFGGNGAGVVYKVDATGYTVLHSFSGEDGLQPAGALIRDSAGNLYGTTILGGTSNAGVVYKLDPAGDETVLYNFQGGTEADGAYPQAGVIRDAEGHLYGTTLNGGAVGFGTVFKLDAAGNFSVLYSFTDRADGGSPMSGVARDSAGNLYGTTPFGGASARGVVYKLDTAGQETALYSFTNTDASGVILDSAGNLYGTTGSGGAWGYGTVYKLDPAGQQTVLYSFMGGADAGSPGSGVTRDSGGNLYGTAYSGGTNNGLVYKLDAGGNLTVLYSFPGGSGGFEPYGGVAIGPAGGLWGTTYAGGKYKQGVIYVLPGAAAAQ